MWVCAYVEHVNSVNMCVEHVYTIMCVSCSIDINAVDLVYIAGADRGFSEGGGG